MLTGHDMIYFGDNWDGVWRNRQQLLSILAQYNRVLFVEKERHIRPTLAQFRQGELGRADLQRPCTRHIGDNLFVFRHPVWAPVSGRFPLKQLTQKVRWLYLQRAIRELGISQPIVWFYHPKWIEMVPRFSQARLRLYHVIDEYSSYQGKSEARRSREAEWEKEMLAQVNAVIVVSEKLYEAKHAYNSHTFIVPNGVNYQAYSEALAVPDLPSELETIPPPRLGYLGLVGDKLDLSILKNLAQENPAWSLVFLGPTNVNAQAQTWQALQAMPNVYYLGSVGVSQVPHYVKGFQVGLMPYLQDYHAETISPLKLYDYLAAGLPIASMDIPAAREFQSHIHLAETPAHFAQAVRDALANTAPERYQARRNLASQHTWQARTERISDLIQTLLDEGSGKNRQK
ncbi:MAG: glycosyltransferase [Chloroflexota bacterium]